MYYSMNERIRYDRGPQSQSEGLTHEVPRPFADLHARVLEASREAAGARVGHDR
jgi:hypothetical protein